MTLKHTISTLKKFGLPTMDALRCATEIEALDAKHARLRHTRNWDRVLAPLTHDIQLKGASRHRWIKDTDRAPVYLAYLQLLRKTRDVIKRAQKLNFDDKSIIEIARDRNLSGDGLHWSHWVPVKVRDAFTAEFDRINSIKDPSTGKVRAGRQMVPFVTSAEKSASNNRWSRLAAQLVAEREARSAQGEDINAPLLELLDVALQTIYARDPERPAPVDWTHLLTPAQRIELDKWRKETMNGVYAPTDTTKGGAPT